MLAVPEPEVSEAIYDATMAGVLREFRRVAIGDPLVMIYPMGGGLPPVLPAMKKMEKRHFPSESGTSDQYQLVVDSSWHYPERPQMLFVMPSRFAAELAQRCARLGIALVRGVPTAASPDGFDCYDPAPALLCAFGITIGAHVFTCVAPPQPLDHTQLAFVKRETATRGAIYSIK